MSIREAIHSRYSKKRSDPAREFAVRTLLLHGVEHDRIDYVELALRLGAYLDVETGYRLAMLGHRELVEQAWPSDAVGWRHLPYNASDDTLGDDIVRWSLTHVNELDPALSVELLSRYLDRGNAEMVRFLSRRIDPIALRGSEEPVMVDSLLAQMDRMLRNRRA
jgi:hypothetical protein